MTNSRHPVFVPAKEGRKNTAILLVGTAREFGIDQHDIVSTSGGFNISQALADVLYDEQDTTQDFRQPGREEDS